MTIFSLTNMFNLQKGKCTKQFLNLDSEFLLGWKYSAQYFFEVSFLSENPQDLTLPE